MQPGSVCRRICCGVGLFGLAIGFFVAPIAHRAAGQTDFLWFHLVVGFLPVANRVNVAPHLFGLLIFRILHWYAGIGI